MNESPVKQTPVDKALEILGQPLGADAEDVLAALEAQDPDDPRWGDIWEGYLAAR
jgi:hypothetical protein